MSREPAPEARTAAPKVEAAAGQIEVAAPMVGTFYRAPTPEAPPFVEVGSVVSLGQPLCLADLLVMLLVTGVRDSSNVQITSGLNKGDTIIVTGLLSVKPDSKVTINKIVNQQKK